MYSTGESDVMEGTLGRQKSVKFHIDDKPSIKITVSSDALAETLKNKADDNEKNGQQTSLIQIVGNCCEGVSSASTGVLCSCANGDDKRTRIALDDFTVLEFPNCIDFGIKDFLCCKDEIELDLSSDTDASYLDATPPHRFSDSELENQIEAMSITLETQLNPFPDQHTSCLLLDSGEGDLTPEEETTEESFIMDEEEASSSASNSAATVCGGDGGNMEFEDTPCTEVDKAVASLSKGDSVDDTLQQSLSSGADEDEAQSAIAPFFADLSSSDEMSHEATEDLIVTPETLDSSAVAPEATSVPTGNDDIESAPQPPQLTRKVMKHPTKQFKRQISLPASIFMSYLIEQNNKANYCVQQNNDNHHHHHNHHHNCDIRIMKNKLNRSNSCSKKSPGNGVVMRPPLAKIDSFRSTKVIHGSTEDYDDEDINNSNSCSDSNEDYSNSKEAAADIDDDEDRALLGFSKMRNWTWDSKSDSFPEPDEDDGPQEELDEEQPAFTSEVEKKSLILRHVRKLIRQDTTGNFAPPDFSI